MVYSGLLHKHLGKNYMTLLVINCRVYWFFDWYSRVFVCVVDRSRPQRATLLVILIWFTIRFSLINMDGFCVTRLGALAVGAQRMDFNDPQTRSRRVRLAAHYYASYTYSIHARPAATAATAAVFIFHVWCVLMRARRTRYASPSSIPVRKHHQPHTHTVRLAPKFISINERY